MNSNQASAALVVLVLPGDDYMSDSDYEEIKTQIIDDLIKHFSKTHRELWTPQIVEEIKSFRFKGFDSRDIEIDFLREKIYELEKELLRYKLELRSTIND